MHVAVVDQWPVALASLVMAVEVEMDTVLVDAVVAGNPLIQLQLDCKQLPLLVPWKQANTATNEVEVVLVVVLLASLADLLVEIQVTVA